MLSLTGVLLHMLYETAWYVKQNYKSAIQCVCSQRLASLNWENGYEKQMKIFWLFLLIPSYLILPNQTTKISI